MIQSCFFVFLVSCLIFSIVKVFLLYFLVYFLITCVQFVPIVSLCYHPSCSSVCSSSVHTCSLYPLVTPVPTCLIMLCFLKLHVPSTLQSVILFVSLLVAICDPCGFASWVHLLPHQLFILYLDSFCLCLVSCYISLFVLFIKILRFVSSSRETASLDLIYNTLF